MDHLLVALLNSAVDDRDPLETPLSIALWWAELARGRTPLLHAGRPRFDAALGVALRDLRAQAARLAAGAAAPLAVRFTGGDSDAIVFEFAYAAYGAVADGTLRRVRRCSGQACGRYFFDVTKNGSRRWCSLRCMERARAPRRRTISR
jgi:predicted RNA-binding Zn ribbon-like protein